MASDYFRYCWLAIHGGLYVDSAFLPGDPARIAAETAHPVFALSVPETDLTPGIARARKVLGKVLLNGILCTSVARCPYFALLSCLVRRLVHERASDLVPMVTGIGVLTMFDYVVSASGLDPRTTLDTLRRAAPPGNDHVLAVISAFMTDHAGDLSRLSPCASKSSVQMGEVFFRPAADQQRFSDPAHWSNYRGSIFSAARSE